MPYKYKEIFGWTDFEDIYMQAVQEFDNGIFIEIGSFTGRSAVLMGELIKESNKLLTLVCVDLFPTKDEINKWRSEGAGQGEELDRILELPDSLLNTFVKNIADAEVEDYIIPIKASSKKAELLLGGIRTYDFIFVDAGHGYERVKNDLELYWPLVSLGGIFAGHDYVDEVWRAVHDFFDPQKILVERRGSSWFVRKT